jgi:predicted small secreted protein
VVIAFAYFKLNKITAWLSQLLRLAYTRLSPLEEITMKNTKIVLLALIVAFTFSLTACNTVEGVGKDVKKVGEKIEKAGDKK